MKKVANGWTRTYEEMKLEIATLRAANESLAKEAAELRDKLFIERTVREGMRNLIERFEGGRS